MNSFNSPSKKLLRKQADWLAPARARALRKIGIAQRKNVLDLGCGFGSVTEELIRRSGGQVVAFDLSEKVLTDNPQSFGNAPRICGTARQLPFADCAFDLVFCQFAILWLDVTATIAEIRRVLKRHGVLLAIEPDYGGMIEYPPESATQDIWIAALNRAGADPYIGRKLSGFLQPPNWTVQVDLLDQLLPPSPERFEILKGLPLTDEEKASLTRIETADAALSDTNKIAHLPMFIVMAEKTQFY